MAAYEVGRLSVRDLDVAGRRVFLRVDMNVPFDEAGNITDDRRIATVLPTLRLLIGKGAIVVVASHLGRPKGKRVESLSMAPVARRLAELLERPVAFLDDCVGTAVENAVAAGEPGRVFVLENLRFHAGEEAGDPDFGARLARLADLYVNDAFGAAHRAHASVTALPALMEQAAAGLLMFDELEHLGSLLAEPRRPFLLVLGGAKVSDKVPLLHHLMPLVDTVLVGGGMAYTFLAARGVPVGNSRVEPDLVETARGLLAEADARGQRVLLPEDHVCAAALAPDAEFSQSSGGVPDGLMGLDIGPATQRFFASQLESARTVLWNGPMGVFEIPELSEGTAAVGRAIAKATDAGAKSVVGGGDTAAAARMLGVADRMTHISTGGGASLEFLSGAELPGVAALTRAGGTNP